MRTIKDSFGEFIKICGKCEGRLEEICEYETHDGEKFVFDKCCVCGTIYKNEEEQHFYYVGDLKEIQISKNLFLREKGGEKK